MRMMLYHIGRQDDADGCRHGANNRIGSLRGPEDDGSGEGGCGIEEERWMTCLEWVDESRLCWINKIPATFTCSYLHHA